MLYFLPSSQVKNIGTSFPSFRNSATTSNLNVRLLHRKVCYLLSWLNRRIRNRTYGGVRGRNFSFKRNSSYSITSKGMTRWRWHSRRITRREPHMIQPDRRQILTMFSQQSKKSRPPNGDSLTVVAKKDQKPPTPVTSSLNFYLSYTPISPSLRLIFSLLFLNNPLINLNSFMNG